MNTAKNVKSLKGQKANGNGNLRQPNTRLVVVGTEDLGKPSREHPAPYIPNPESKEDRAKRLQKRKALLLKIFQAAYEDNLAKG